MLFGRKPACSTLSMRDAHTRLGQDATITVLDVRSPEEYRQGHIPGSINLPVERIGQIGTLLPDKTAQIYVYCLSGGRSHAACAQLVRMGYTDITNIGGIVHWPGALRQAAG